MSPPLPDRALRAFGRTEGDADDLGLLVRDQDTRRLVLLRALLDAGGAAPATVCPPDRLDRLRQDWALLEAAERADRTAVRAVLLHPLVGPWAQSCLRGLTATAPTPNFTRTSTIWVRSPQRRRSAHGWLSRPGSPRAADCCRCRPWGPCGCPTAGSTSRPPAAS